MHYTKYTTEVQLILVTNAIGYVNSRYMVVLTCVTVTVVAVTHLLWTEMCQRCFAKQAPTDVC
jgi:hypothetical protein